MFAFSAQSFAPFAFSPIAFAIQTLIEELKEERRQVYGSGKGRGGKTPGQARTAPTPWQRDEGLTEAEVQAQWDLLEARLAAQQRPAERQAPAPKPAPSIPAAPAVSAEPAGAPAAAAGLAAAPALREDDATDDESEALALLLALV